jgi:predicted tellurium resistance membrane protein TerC
MFDHDRTDAFLTGVFGAIVLTVVAVSTGSGLTTFAGLLGIFFFLYLWLMSGLEERSSDSTRV